MLSFLVSGDFCMYNRMQNYSCSEIVATMSSVIPYVREVDYSLVNLECSIFDDKYMPIIKCGVNLSNTSEAIKALKQLGFKGVTLANNHFADYGSEAVDESLRLLDKYGIDYYGAGRNINEASQVKYISIKGESIAIINCCEHEYTIANETKAGCNPLDVVGVCRAILNAKKEANYTIVIVHGGSEHYNLPTPRMQKWYRFFVEAGADAVINHHQHCYSGYEFYLNKPIVYGLGNFCFDWDGKRNSSWNDGYMVQLMLDKTIKLILIPYVQCNEESGIFVLKNREKFDKSIVALNSIISNPNEVQRKYDDFIIHKREEYLEIFKYPQNSILKSLAKKGLLPKRFASALLPKTTIEDEKRLLTMLSYFQCEAHHDIMTALLSKQKDQ